MSDPYLIYIILGVCAFFLFPMVAIGIHGWWERRHQRRMHRRRQDRHRLL